MRRKGPRRPRQAARQLVTAAELARRRGVDARTVRRWVRAGCPVARRGKAGHRAPRFDEAKVAVWLAKSETEDRAMVAELINVTDARARRTRGDLERLQAAHIRPDDMAAVWPPLVAEVRESALAVVPELAARVLEAAHHPPTRQSPATSRRTLEAAELLAILAGAAPRPWKAPAEPSIRQLAERGGAIEIDADGAWSEGAGPRVHSQPMSSTAAVAAEIRRSMRALLAGLAQAAPPSAPSVSADALPTVTPSKTLRAARAQLASFQARLVDLRGAIASGTLARLVDVEHAYYDRVMASRAVFLGLEGRAPELAGAVAGGRGLAYVTEVLRNAVTAAIDALTPRKDAVA